MEWLRVSLEGRHLTIDPYHKGRHEEVSQAKENEASKFPNDWIPVYVSTGNAIEYKSSV